MITKVIFNTDKKLKAAAQRKARKQGMTLTAVLNIATEAYVNDRLKISAFDQMLVEAREDIRQGRTIPAEEVYKRFGIKIH